MNALIQSFLKESKEKKLKEKLKETTDSGSISEIMTKIEEEFSLENWIPNAAKRAHQLSIVSHPGKFSHPNADVSPILVFMKKKHDGFIRSGNVEVENDALGTAALDVYKFLSLVMIDGRTILKHLDESSDLIKSALSLESKRFEEMRGQFLEIKKTKNSMVSSDIIKQVYYPVGGDYHLLSILTPSGLVYELKNRIGQLKFSDNSRDGREFEKKNEYHSKGFDEIYNLAKIKYGGSNPQNISALNSTERGTAYLLSSFPPKLFGQYRSRPTLNFFTQIIWPKKYTESFVSLHELLDADVNNIHVRKNRDNIIQFITNEIIDVVWSIRSTPAGWSTNDRYIRLPKYQKVILDQAMDEERTENAEWLNEFIQQMARWFISAYKNILRDDALPFHDDELRHIQKIMQSSKDHLI